MYRDLAIKAIDAIRPGERITDEFAKHRDANKRTNPNRSRGARLVDGLIAAGLEAPGVIYDGVTAPFRAADRLRDAAFSAVTDTFDPPDPPVAAQPSTVGDLVKRGGISTPPVSGQAGETSLGDHTANVSGSGSNTLGASSGTLTASDARLARMRDDFPGLLSFSGKIGASKAEREASAFGSGRRRTQVAMGEEIQFNEDDARRPGQLARQAFRRSEEDRELKRRAAELALEQELSEARARLGFETKHGVPYDPETAKYVTEAERHQAMDNDFRAAMNAAYAKLISGEYRDPAISDPAVAQAAEQEAYEDAVRQLSIQWGVRKNAPEGYFRSMQREAMFGG